MTDRNVKNRKQKKKTKEKKQGKRQKTEKSTVKNEWIRTKKTERIMAGKEKRMDKDWNE